MTLLLGHAGDDRLDPRDLALVDVGAGGHELACPRDHLEDVAERTHLLELAHLRQHVLEREVAQVLHLALVFVRLERARLLDERHHVAHAEDAAGDAVRVERLEPVDLLAHAGEVDRLAGHVLGRQRGPAAGVAVELGHDQAADADALIEGGGDRQRLLAGHGVDHQDPLARFQQPAELGQFVHERFVDLQPTGGVDDHQVAEVLAQVLAQARVDGLGRLAVEHLEHRNADLLPQGAQLLACRRPLGVGRHQQHAPTLRLVLVGQLAGRGGLPGALQAHQQPDVALGAKRRLDRLPAEDVDQLVVDDGDDALFGLQRHQHVRTDGLLLHSLRELAGHFEVHVGLEQRDAHLAQRRLDVGFGQSAAAAQAVEHGLESVA